MSIFRRGPDRGDVEAQLENVRGLVELLSLSRANLSAANALLREAGANLAQDDTMRAQAACVRAEAIATSLEADYKTATAAVAAIRTRVERMEALGMPVAEEEKALGAVHARATATRELEGVVVPDYAGARTLATEAAERAEAKLALADRASDAVFSAEMAVDGAAETFGKGPVDALQEPRALLERARAGTASGDFERATADAAIAEKLALGAIDRRRQAHETLESVERIVAGLRSVGISVTSVMRSLDLGRILLAKGKLLAAVDVFNEAAQDAVQIGQRYRHLLDAISDGQRTVEALRADGLPVGEAEYALARAKAAMKAGNYALAAGCADDVKAAGERQREAREILRAQIEATKVQAQRLRELGMAYANDVEEMVGKAEREFLEGDFAGTSEDLRIASLLIRPVKPQNKESPVPR